MKEVVFHYVKKCTLVVANKTTLLHGKDNTFRSGHPEVAERFDQILSKTDCYEGVRFPQKNCIPFRQETTERDAV